MYSKHYLLINSNINNEIILTMRCVRVAYNYYFAQLSSIIISLLKKMEY